MSAKKPSKAKAAPKAASKPKKGSKPPVAAQEVEARARPPKHAGGRPTLYSDELAMRICEKVSEGWSTRRICNEDWAPDKATFFRWQAAQPEFCDLLARARDMRADAEFEETLEIADDGSADWTTRKDSRGNEYEVVNQEVVQRSKLRVETRLRRIALMSPRFRPSSKMELTGKDGAPLHGNLTDAELDAKIAELIRQTGASFPAVGKSAA